MTEGLPGRRAADDDAHVHVGAGILTRYHG